ncbi:uncharacterized protein [Physcomitrium patens]|nr:uncharacterized protein LOC112278070 isoform X2 [Physcomitrium patens]XP_024366870.1 uncharacterized protein LOC112278070 isoform X2 [Physcomitrium patens]|eukprot:XP_024366869.1 uncharacterized protein LOC112278070 isoform X2 [Physcomitrella patens]
MMDRSKSNKRNWILVWEGGFCNFSACATGLGNDGRPGSLCFQGRQQPQGSDEPCEAMSPELFFKMSHEVYNYGEGLLGKVAADNGHKWVYREPVEYDISFLSPWHGSLEPHPCTWEAQFKSGIQTIAVMAVQEGVIQLGSTKRIVEELNFILHLQRRFNYLQSIPGVLVPHPFSCASRKRLIGNGPPPAGRGHRMAIPDYDKPTSNLNLPVRSVDQFMSSRIGPQLWRSSSDTTVLGLKRPLDSDPLPLCTDHPYMNTGEGFHHQRESPSPMKSLNTGLTSAQGGASPTIPNLLSSMSSLQALLSKLPSVKPTEMDSNNCTSVVTATSSGFDATAGISGRPPVSRSVVNKMAKERAASSKETAAAENGYVPGDSQTHLNPASKTKAEPVQDQNIDIAGAATTSTSSPSSGNSDVVSAEHASDVDTEVHQTGTSECKSDSQKAFCSSTFLDTFDNLADFGTLAEAGDSYNLFLSEMYSG